MIWIWVLRRLHTHPDSNQCRPRSKSKGVGSGPELKSMWPRFGPVLLYLVYSWLTLGLPLAYLWPKSGKQERTAQVPSFHAVCGSDESVRCGPHLGLRNFAIWDRGYFIYVICAVAFIGNSKSRYLQRSRSIPPRPNTLTLPCLLPWQNLRELPWQNCIFDQINVALVSMVGLFFKKQKNIVNPKLFNSGVIKNKLI